MRHNARVPVFVAAVLFMSACASDGPAAPDAESTSPPVRALVTSGFERSIDRHVVVFNGGAPADFDQTVSALGGTVATTLSQIGVAFVIGLDDEAAAGLTDLRGVTSVGRDFEAEWIPSGAGGGHEGALDAGTDGAGWAGVTGGSGIGGTDPTLAESYDVWQWNMRRVRAHEAWPITRQGEGVRVAILDSGIDITHQDLVGRVDIESSTSIITSSPCGAADTESIDDLHGHGSFVGAIVSSNGVRVASVAPQARLIGVKVLRCDNRGAFGDFIAGLVHAADVGADIANLSIHSFTQRREVHGALVSAFNRAATYANRKGTLVVSITGNFALDMDRERDLIILPGEAAATLTVGATGPTRQQDFDRVTGYSDIGFSIVDMVAPGGNAGTGDRLDGIRSVCATNSRSGCASGTTNLVGWQGTSFAAPMVAGAAAVLLGENPSLTPSQLHQCLVHSAEDLGKIQRDAEYGWGRLDLMAALERCGPKGRR